ncbi:hypothetical protein [Mucilaginibacter aquariorum]|uniref:Uncharacterized protein n=1 Tax=Mucilaginibacter aquariorum TaxID=2967225 RepID=A0ABT1T3P7_9SPHI|nr:hypothetical protein [Mucilaginibacter aquariorum]MCQ6959235.1 hypothetical protein [Mucilaginibacter aquariorum]
MDTMLLNSSRPLQYYVIARRWSSDLEFFRLESGFLQRLLDRYMSRLQGHPQFVKLVKAGEDLQELERMVDGDLLDRQLTQLELMAEDVIPEDADALTEVQVKLERLMSKLTQRFREVKQEVYALVLEAPDIDILL